MRRKKRKGVSEKEEAWISGGYEAWNEWMRFTTDYWDWPSWKDFKKYARKDKKHGWIYPEERKLPPVPSRSQFKIHS